VARTRIEADSSSSEEEDIEVGGSERGDIGANCNENCQEGEEMDDDDDDGFGNDGDSVVSDDDEFGDDEEERMPDSEVRSFSKLSVSKKIKTKSTKNSGLKKIMIK